MISKILYIFTDGLNQLRLNTHFLLAAVLVLVLPVLFVWVGQNFFETSYQNILTVQKQQVSVIHDSIQILHDSDLPNEQVNNILQNLVDEQVTLTKVRILDETTDGLLIIASNNPSEIQSYDGGNQLYATAAVSPGETLIFDFVIDNVRTWQAFREVTTAESKYYIFSEHSFSEIDSVLLARQQQTYLFLPVIFLFLIFLAYWLVKQTQWQKQYASTKKKLDEQMLFTNTIAHELRAPLTAIRGYVSFLLESKDISEQNFSYAKNINTSSERLLALINDFLEVARIQSGKLQISHSEVDITKTIQSVIDEFTPVAESKGLKLISSVAKKQIFAHTDEMRLQQVLTNIVSNSVKYTDHGTVTIALEQTKLKTIIRVKDTGKGISAEDQKKLFTPFTRVGTAEKSGTTGTGLGMWITKELVGLLGGSVQIESIEGVGTHIKLVFDV